VVQNLCIKLAQLYAPAAWTHFVTLNMQAGVMHLLCMADNACNRSVLLHLCVCRQQAVATETVEAIEAAEVNGNGAGAVTNVNGNGNGNGSKVSGASSNGTSTLKVVVPAAATAAAAAAAPAAAAAMAISNGNGKAAAAAASEAERMRLLNTIDEEQNAEAAGQLELAAATAKQRKDRTAAGTPYKAPGGNWSKFKTYSVWQVGAGWWSGGVTATVLVMYQSAGSGHCLFC
jgi:hypothetical protein